MKPQRIPLRRLMASSGFMPFTRALMPWRLPLQPPSTLTLLITPFSSSTVIFREQTPGRIGISHGIKAPFVYSGGYYTPRRRFWQEGILYSSLSGFRPFREKFRPPDKPGPPVSSGGSRPRKRRSTPGPGLRPGCGNYRTLRRFCRAWGRHRPHRR